MDKQKTLKSEIDDLKFKIGLLLQEFKDTTGLKVKDIEIQQNTTLEKAGVQWVPIIIELHRV